MTWLPLESNMFIFGGLRRRQTGPVSTFPQNGRRLSLTSTSPLRHIRPSSMPNPEADSFSLTSAITSATNA